MYLGYISLNVGDHERARSYFTENLELGHRLDDKFIVVRSLGNLGLVAQELTDYPTAKRYLEEAVAIAEVLGAREPLLVTTSNLGTTELRLKNYDAAERNYQLAVDYARAAGAPYNLAVNTINLAEVSHYRGDLSLAVARYSEGLSVLRESGELSPVRTLESIAFLLIDLGSLRSQFNCLA